MNSGVQKQTEGDESFTTCSYAWLLALVVVAFIAMRLPPVLCAPGGQDEEWFAVPGLTVAQEGIPRVPYSRATEPDSFFLGAERILYAMPPLSFYLQSPFFFFLAPTYSTARLVSLLSACLTILITYSLGKSFLSDKRVAFQGALFYSLSRLCFFPAVTARPDMLCGMFGLTAVLCTANGVSRPKRWLLCAAGVSTGLAALCHPFAIVFAVQLTIWILINAGTWRLRLTHLALFALSVTSAFSLWLPLIAIEPAIFPPQFVGNILRPDGPSILSRLVLPYESFASQIPQLFDRAHPIQFMMLCLGLLGSGVLAWKSRLVGARSLWLLATTYVYLLVTLVGVHPIQGYWCYGASLAWLCFAYVTVKTLDWICEKRPAFQFAKLVIPCAIVIMMMPGAGVRTSVTYATRLADPTYNGAKFAQIVLDDLPRGSSLTVGPEFTLDAYGQGWNVILACRHPRYFDSVNYPTDYYIFGRRDLAEGFPHPYECDFVRSYGSKDDIFANYAEVYRRR